jgi:hypothetical protein
VSGRLATLRAALGFLTLGPREPELRLLHRCCDTWRGIGDIVAGMARQEYDHVETLRLAHYNGHLVRRRGRIPRVSPRRKAKKSL